MYFEPIDTILFEGAASKNPLAFHDYDPERLILGKKMKEHLPFAMAWWHNPGAAGTDMFGRDTADKSFDCTKTPWSMPGPRWMRALNSCRSWASAISASTTWIWCRKPTTFRPQPPSG